MSEPDLMSGFPPVSGAQVSLANWRQPPFNRWGFQHVREIVPSADIANRPDDVWRLPEKLVDLSVIEAESGGSRVGYPAFLENTDTDAFVVLHRGAVIEEFYANGMKRQSPHILMSVSKSVLGLVAAILTERGVLDPEALLTDIISEMAGTAYAGARIGQLLDMRVGVEFEENYLATSGRIIEYRKSHLWNPLDPGDTPTDMRTFFAKLVERGGQHGDHFHYVSPNTDLMGWVIERAAGKRYADLVSELIWQPLGAAFPAYITVDRLGAPRCAGGMCTTALDLARLGQLLVQNGKRDGAQIVPKAWIDDIRKNGNTDAWQRGDFREFFGGLDMHYRWKWYVLRSERPVIFGFGVNGQHLYVDIDNQIVVAKLSSQAASLDATRVQLTNDMVIGLIRHLSR